MWLTAMVVLGWICISFNRAPGSIRGSVVPADKTFTVTAISTSDTLPGIAAPGRFIFTHIHAGTYQLIIESGMPAKRWKMDSVTVVDGGITDLGEIDLE